MNEYLMTTNVKYGVNNMSIKKDERQKLHDTKMNSLSSMCGMTKMDRVRNNEFSLSIGVREELSDIK